MGYDVDVDLQCADNTDVNEELLTLWRIYNSLTGPSLQWTVLKLDCLFNYLIFYVFYETLFNENMFAVIFKSLKWSLFSW